MILLAATGYPEYGEARYFADQSGVFEIMSTSDPSHQKVMTQVVATLLFCVWYIGSEMVYDCAGGSRATNCLV